jgi:hypothetical protein
MTGRGRSVIDYIKTYVLKVTGFVKCKPISREFWTLAFASSATIITLEILGFTLVVFPIV